MAHILSTEDIQIVGGQLILDAGKLQVGGVNDTAAGRQLLSATDVAAQRTWLGVNNVDNTSDANKPISSATQTALNLKADLTVVAGVSSTLNTSVTAHTTRTDNPHSVTKSQVGLGNVDNTSDANKPISTATQTALNLKADLVGGLIPVNQLPGIALTDTFVVASQSAMLALSNAQQGDLAIRTDLNKTFVLATSSYSTLADWKELLTPTDSVQSVNGKTGAVTISASDINISQGGTVQTFVTNVISGTQVVGAATSATTAGSSTTAASASNATAGSVLATQISTLSSGLAAITSGGGTVNEALTASYAKAGSALANSLAALSAKDVTIVSNLTAGTTIVKYATSATTAGTATLATSALSAGWASFAVNASTATNANYATSAGSAATAGSAGTATTAASASNAVAGSNLEAAINSKVSLAVYNAYVDGLATGANVVHQALYAENPVVGSALANSLAALSAKDVTIVSNLTAGTTIVKYATSAVEAGTADIAKPSGSIDTRITGISSVVSGLLGGSGTVTEAVSASYAKAGSPLATSITNRLGLSGSNYVIVDATPVSATTKGTNLRNAYAYAKTLSPTGTNRVVVLIPPGVYDLGTTGLAVDTQYIDLVGMAGPDECVITSADVTSNSGTIVQTANDVKFYNLTMQYTGATGVTFTSSQPCAYMPSTNLYLTYCENIKFVSINLSYTTRLNVEYSGTFKNCYTNGSYAFGSRVSSYGVAGAASGTFINCETGVNGFGSGSGCSASGTFIGCTGGSFSFGGEGTASGTFTNCIGSYFSFGGAFGTASGKFIGCVLGSKTGGTTTYGTNAWGGTFSGYMENCIWVVTNTGAPCLTVATGAKVYGSTFKNGADAYPCITASAGVSASIAHCRMNDTIHSNITNYVNTPYNVLDPEL